MFSEATTLQPALTKLDLLNRFSQAVGGGDE
jgi:hypothetical protein